MADSIKKEDFEKVNKTESVLYAYLIDSLLFQEFNCIETKEKTTISVNDFKTNGVDASKLLELRIFNKVAEVRFFRSNIYSPWKARYRCDDGEEFFEQKHYLDIDTSKEQEGGMVIATGGGKYPLPINLGNNKDIQLKIHNYIDYYESGQAYIKDWRMVDLIPMEEGEKHGK